MVRGQAERLVPLLEELLNEAGKGWCDLNGIGVGIGPGNFTGIRISVATARGLSMSLRVPAIGVSGFDALSRGGPERLYLPATRDRIYLQTRDADGTPSAPALIDASDPRWLGLFESGQPTRGVRLSGVGTASPSKQLAPENPAPRIAELASARLVQSDSDFERPAPLYVRPPDAAPAKHPTPNIVP